MAKAFNTSELDAALDDVKFPADDRPKTLDDLPNDVLVSVFEAVDDLHWVRRTVPLVCKAWNELYCSQDASPLHKTLEVDFQKELASAAARDWESRGGLAAIGMAAAQSWALRHPVHASSVLSWAERRADGSVRKLVVKGEYGEGACFGDFRSRDVGRLVAAVSRGPSLTELRVELRKLPRTPHFWESVRDSVAPHGKLRSLVVKGVFADASEADVEPLGQQLAGSLEELSLDTAYFDDPASFAHNKDGLSRLPESVCDLAELRRLKLIGHVRLRAIPAKISSLQKLEEFVLIGSPLYSLPKELGELSRLEKLDLTYNVNLGSARRDEAFPAELAKMKSLTHLKLAGCDFRAVPAFVGELESLEFLDLSGNAKLGNAPRDEAFPAGLGRKTKSLDFLEIACCKLRAVPAFVGELKSLCILNLRGNNLESVPAFVCELKSLVRLDLSENEKLGNAPRNGAFPARLGRTESLRNINLRRCGLRTVPAFVGNPKSLEILQLAENNLQNFPAFLGGLKSLTTLTLAGCGLRAVPDFVGKLESLEVIDLSFNNARMYGTLGVLIRGCPRLREVVLLTMPGAGPPAPGSLARVKTFTEMLLAKNPNAEVLFGEAE